MASWPSRNSHRKRSQDVFTHGPSKTEFYRFYLFCLVTVSTPSPSDLSPSPVGWLQDSESLSKEGGSAPLTSFKRMSVRPERAPRLAWTAGSGRLAGVTALLGAAGTRGSECDTCVKSRAKDWVPVHVCCFAWPFWPVSPPGSFCPVIGIVWPHGSAGASYLLPWSGALP